jgi:hypothetical protein
VKRIIFFNYYHNGDIHVSREFVRLITNKVRQLEPDTQFAYGHRNYFGLLGDIPELFFDHAALNVIRNDKIGVYQHDTSTYINTWYGQQDHKYTNNYGLSIDALYAAFEDTCQLLWGFSLADISTDLTKFFPTIDYSKFHIEPTTQWLASHPGKKVFVSNGKVLSDQAHMFSLTPIIAEVAAKHHDKIFILSNRDWRYKIREMPNLFYSDQIIQKKQNDLNENSFLSSHCDVIIGKASGAFTFTMTQENLFQRKIKIIAFCNIKPRKEGKFWMNGLFEDKVNYLSDVIVSNDSGTNLIISIIDKHIS